MDTSVLKKLWPTPSSPALKLTQVSDILGVSPVEAGKKLARMEKAGLVIRSGQRMCDSQRDPVILWDTTDKGDEEIAKFESTLPRVTRTRGLLPHHWPHARLAVDVKKPRPEDPDTGLVLKWSHPCG